MPAWYDPNHTRVIHFKRGLNMSNPIKLITFKSSFESYQYTIKTECITPKR